MCSLCKTRVMGFEENPWGEVRVYKKESGLCHRTLVFSQPQKRGGPGREPGPLVGTRLKLPYGVWTPHASEMLSAYVSKGRQAHQARQGSLLLSPSHVWRVNPFLTIHLWSNRLTAAAKQGRDGIRFEGRGLRILLLMCCVQKVEVGSSL